MVSFQAVPLASTPTVTAQQMRAVDRRMIDELGIDLARMMENAGNRLAALAIDLFAPATVAVLAGPGGNGGGGLTAARHLSNRGVGVSVILSHGEARLATVSAEQLAILRRMGVAVANEPPRADLVVDALIGYSLHGPPRGRVAELIGWANGSGASVLSLDVPSGLEATTGIACKPCIRAAATMTLGLPKTGLEGAPGIVGRLFLTDISIPPLVYERIGLKVPRLFDRNAIVELTT
jgi:NAD(P)H-hydrate epimerase